MSTRIIKLCLILVFVKKGIDPNMAKNRAKTYENEKQWCERHNVYVNN